MFQNVLLIHIFVLLSTIIAAFNFFFELEHFEVRQRKICWSLQENHISNLEIADGFIEPCWYGLVPTFTNVVLVFKKIKHFCQITRDFDFLRED